MVVPLSDIRAQYHSLKRPIDEALARVIESGAFVGGTEISAFEDEFATYCEVSHCVGVGNGTDALTLALTAMGIGPGDEVITVANTFIATIEAIWATGANLCSWRFDRTRCSWIRTRSATRSALARRL